MGTALSSVFLFGAGASYGSGPCHPYAPPLGGDLFAALQKEGGVAATVGNELAAVFARDFEEGMDRFWAERNTETTRLLREMAAYFARFEPRPGNYYSELLHLLGGTRKRATFVTTNYDLLIELAASNAGLKISYSGFPVPDKNIPLIKMHGSCNFLPALEPRQITGIGFDLSNSPGGSIIEAGVRVARSTMEVLEFCQREDSIAPAIAMYSPDKRVLFCRSFVQAQQEAWQRALKEASRVFTLGLRVHPVDKHIWEPLGSASAALFYVGREPDAFLEWAASEKRRNAFVLAQTFQNAIPQIAQQLGIRHRTR